MPGYRVLAKLLLLLTFICQSGECIVAQPSSAVSRPEIIKEFVEEEFQIYQFEVSSISRFSYMLVSSGQALLIDPVRDIEAYLDHAGKIGVAWAGVLLTHSHTDFVAGHREMALATGAPIHLSHRSEALFPHMQLKGGDQIKVGQVRIEIIDAPGHTVDSVIALISTINETASATYAFSGDNFPLDGTILLEPYTHRTNAAQLASRYFESWRQKVLSLPSNTVLLPSRYCCWVPSSLANAAATFTTVAALEAENPIFAIENRSEFIAQVLRSSVQLSPGLPGILKLNLQGPPIMAGSLIGERINEFSVIPGFRNTKIIDVRPAKEFFQGNIRGSINLPLQGRLETVGNMILSDSERIIVVGNDEQIKEAGLRLARIGLKADYIIWREYSQSQAPVVTFSEMEAAELNDRINEKSAPLIVDVRMPAEYRFGRIPSAISIPLGELEHKAPLMLDKAEEIVVVCSTSYRSGAAMGILRGQGFEFVTHVVGGMNSWRENDYHQVLSTSMVFCSHRGYCSQNIPGVITPAELHDLWSNSPEKLKIFDIRAKHKINDYNPFAISFADQNQQLECIAKIGADKMIIILSDDVAEAMIYAGKISATTKATIRILKGGLSAWWYYSKLRQLNLLHEHDSQLLIFEDEYGVKP